MKNSVIILGFMLLLSIPASAAVTPEQMRSDEFIQNHGYSPETVRLIDLQHAQVNGQKCNYTPAKTPTLVASEKLEKKYKYFKPVHTVWTKFFNYMDCARNDGKFGQRIIRTGVYDDL